MKVVALFVRYLGELVTLICLLIFLLVLLFAYQNPNPTGKSAAGLVAPSSTYENIFYFLQVSDIHLSIYVPERQEQFAIFCNETVPIISPTLVLNTGDITDAVKGAPGTSIYYGNQQHEEEWISYRNILDGAGYFNRSFWLDLRGNHDAYAVLKGANYYQAYAVYGDGVASSENEHFYTYALNQSFGSYQFVAMDLAYDLGVSAPFDFFGVRPKQMEQVEAALNNHANFNHTILFGHYPRVSSSNRIKWDRMINGKASIYLCGHFHADKMYRRFGDYYELELEDMKTHQRYRILAIDHDLLSWTDTHLRVWPLIHITNPKNSNFLLENEPLDLIARSTYIRVLVFSNTSIVSVTVQIDGGEEYQMVKAEGANPMYVYPWNPMDYDGGQHTITVTATDSGNAKQTQTQEFTVNKEMSTFEKSAGFVIQGVGLHLFIQITFALMYVYGIGLMLIFPRIYFQYFVKKDYMEINMKQNETSPLISTRSKTLSNLIQIEIEHKLEVYNSLSNFNWIVMMIFWLNLIVGPIAIGPVITTDHYGGIFIWGVAAYNSATVTVESLICGWLLLALVYLPGLHILQHIDYRKATEQGLFSVGLLFYLIVFFAAAIFLSFLVFLYETWTGLILSVGFLWFIIAVIILIIYSIRRTHYRDLIRL